MNFILVIKLELFVFINMIICYSFSVDLEILNIIVLKLDSNSQNMVIENNIKIKF